MDRREERGPPGAWSPARRAAKRVMEPLERFLHVEAASGIVLVVAAAIGLAWANSPWSGAYEALWHTKVVAGIGNTLFEQTLHFWINEGLMTIFFFVVGLEIRREIHEGELSDLRKAALPVVAAIGGMAAPALIFAVVNAGDERALRGFDTGGADLWIRRDRIVSLGADRDGRALESEIV